MISYSLICSQEHEFEAWFKSSGDYDKQLNSGFLACPICGDVRIRKALMAPAVRSSKKSLNKNVEEFSDLPQNAQDYIMYLSEELNTPIEIVSVGPKRHQIIIHK